MRRTGFIIWSSSRWGNPDNLCAAVFINNKNQKVQPKTSRGSSFATAVATISGQAKSKADLEHKQCVNHAFKRPCMFCGKKHTMEVCEMLKLRPNKEKVEYMKDNGLCFGCLEKGHMSKACKKRMTCQICRKIHPTILHIETKEKQSQEPAQTERPDATMSSALVSLNAGSHTGAGAKECALAIVPVKVKLGNGTVTTYAFLDGGSTATFCSEALMHQLNAKGKRVGILLKTMGQERPVVSYKIPGLQVAALKGKAFLKLPDVYTHETIPVTTANIPQEEDIKKWPYLQKLDLARIDAGIGLLIGVDAPKAMEPLRVINSEGSGPYAVETLLGWVINGPLVSSGNGDGNSGVVQVNRISIEDLLVQQYNQDFVEQHGSDKNEMSVEDQQFMDIASRSAVLKNGHYSLKLPFRNSNVCLPNNKAIALQRAHHLIKRFKKDLKFFYEYKDFMSDVISKGYAEVIPQDQLGHENGKVLFVPHNGVYHPRKKTLRVVFDCASAYGGTSLNKELLQGPNLTNSLLGVLHRFRQGPIAFMTDIEGMFHQVKVAKEDVSFLRFLWWPDGDITKDLVEHRMTVHIFGAVSSPSCATFALLKTADDHQNEYPPEVTNTIRQNFYVDDCLKSVNTVGQAIALYQHLTELCAKGGFPLNKWISNHRSVLAAIPEDQRAKGVKTLDLDRDQLPMERALGAQWNVEQDAFTFSIEVKPHSVTRRILSIVSSVYDPLGFLAPVVLPAKQILQGLCKTKLGWDDPIPQEAAQVWQKWLDE